MPIPYKFVDMRAVVARMARKTPGELRTQADEAIRSGHEDLMRWLSQYDETGYLKPEYKANLDYVVMRAYCLSHMAKEEQAAYVVSEKKRLGVL